ncbi:MAG: chromosomal replication initiator protein DnaA [Candidatus Omnitrophica bacterium]|nr:chromosomal replication initiator protein DnaA [Candidatus Omnitrophota bacterium]
MSTQLLEIWQKAQEPIREQIGTTSYETWFSAIQIKEKDHQTILIETPDAFFKNWIVDHYEEKLKDILNSFSTTSINIEFSVNSTIFSSSPQQMPNLFEESKKETIQTPSNLNTRFTFENFVIGPSNRFACAAGLAVAESPARAYNPLFIYGQVGLGKTHLIQAITHKIHEINPQLKLSYMSSEKFTNELIDAIRHRSTVDFRKKYREIDVLLIDDIQFIAGKESTQEEFFHTFNNLHNNKKQIIITSDRPPKEIANLEERLRSRFAWGLITDIQPPDYETRLAILRKKVELETVKVPDDIISFIAEEIKSNIRELEGALIRVTAYAMLEDSPLTLEMAKIILKDMVKESIKTISIEMIQKAVANFYQMPLSDLRAKRRNKNIVLARQVAMYLARQMSNMSYPEIGHAFGGKDHTTVLHSCKKIEQEILTNRELKNTLDQISRSLKQ